MTNKDFIHELVIETDLEDTKRVLLQANLSLFDIIYSSSPTQAQKTCIILHDDEKKGLYKYTYHFAIQVNKLTKNNIKKNINRRLNILWDNLLESEEFGKDIFDLNTKYKLNSKSEENNWDKFFQKTNNNPRAITDLCKKYKISNFFEKSIFYTLILEIETDKRDVLKLLLGHLIMTHSLKACYNFIPMLKYDNFLNEYNLQCLLFDDTKENDIKNGFKAIKYLQNLAITPPNKAQKKNHDIIKYIQIDTLDRLNSTQTLPDWEKAIRAYGEDDESDNFDKERKNTNKFKKQKERAKKFFQTK